jgi:hypothetical protein
VNQLESATSPYLRQHAGNPVAWRQWSEAAFAEARERDVPVFLSIGYSACHWCHVIGGPLKVETAGLKSYDLGAKRRLVAHRSALFRSFCNA